MRILITGAAGFIGSNLCVHFARLGCQIVGVDDLSRPGVAVNVQRLATLKNIELIEARVGEFCQYPNRRHARLDAVFHLAGQVSLAASYADPRNDFDRNVGETFNLLMLVRESCGDIPVVISSSNKVYGSILGDHLDELETRYSSNWLTVGIDEGQLIHPRGPYSLSKLCAEWYAEEFANSYGLNTIVFRKSAIAGPWQQPQSDQGWLSFLIQETLGEREITFNGVGKQVRDVLHVDDLCMLYQKVIESGGLPGHNVFNVGGGPHRALSLRELLLRLEDYGLTPRWRAGATLANDQPIFVSNTGLAERTLGWHPEKSLSTIIDDVVKDQSRDA